jgi:hypothetical protein
VFSGEQVEILKKKVFKQLRFKNSAHKLQGPVLDPRASDDDQQNNKVDGGIKVFGATGQLKKRPRDIKLKHF